MAVFRLKALLHVAKVIDETKEAEHFGVTFGEPKIDMEKVRAYKDGIIKRLTGGLSMMAKQRKVEVVTGFATFLDDHTLEVDRDGEKSSVGFKYCIIAAGSTLVKLPFLPEDSRASWIQRGH